MVRARTMARAQTLIKARQIASVVEVIGPRQWLEQSGNARYHHDEMLGRIGHYLHGAQSSSKLSQLKINILYHLRED